MLLMIFLTMMVWGAAGLSAWYLFYTPGVGPMNVVALALCIGSALMCTLTLSRSQR